MIYDNKPYVYKLTHKETGKFYFGYRMANEVESHLDIGLIYKTSSKVIREIGFDEFYFEVLLEFYDIDRTVAGNIAYWFEQDLIKTNFHNDMCLNLNYVDSASGKRAFRRSGKHSDSTRNKMRLSKTGNISEEQKERIRESNRARVNSRPDGWVVHNKGKRHSIESIDKMRQKRTKETCERIGASKRGTKRTEKTLIKLRDLYSTAESRLKIKSRFTQEVRDKITTSKSKIFELLSPDGIKFRDTNLTKFCKANNLCQPEMSKLCRGVIKTYKGWSGNYSV